VENIITYTAYAIRGDNVQHLCIGYVAKKSLRWYCTCVMGQATWCKINTHTNDIEEYLYPGCFHCDNKNPKIDVVNNEKLYKVGLYFIIYCRIYLVTVFMFVILL